jgi:hypothetical protein
MFVTYFRYRTTTLTVQNPAWVARTNPTVAKTAAFVAGDADTVGIVAARADRNRCGAHSVNAGGLQHSLRLRVASARVSPEPLAVRLRP